MMAMTNDTHFNKNIRGTTMSAKNIGLICGIISGVIIVGATVALNSKTIQSFGNRVIIKSKKLVKSTNNCDNDSIDVNKVIENAQKTLTDLQAVINAVADTSKS